MRNVKYTDSINFRCLEHLKDTFLDITLIHAGREQCKPMQIYSGERTEYILHFVISGKGFYSTDSNTYPLESGQMFLISPGRHVSYGADAKDPCRYAWIGFKGVRAETILKQCGFSSKKPVLTLASRMDDILNYIDNILDCRALTTSDEMRREAWMLEIFAKLIDDNAQQKQKISSKSNSRTSGVYAELAIEHINNYYNDGCNVSDIAENIGISRAYLNHVFQKELGMSIQKFLIDFRMHKAASLLVNTPYSINEIAKAVGYEDQLAFSKSFKKKFEVSPKSYRSFQATTVVYSEKQLADNKEDFT